MLTVHIDSWSSGRTWHTCCPTGCCVCSSCLAAWCYWCGRVHSWNTPTQWFPARYRTASVKKKKHFFVHTSAGHFTEMLSPLSTIRSKWCFSSFSQPGIATLQPYRPLSDSVMLSMVRETSPLSSWPTNWYLLEALVPFITLSPFVEMIVLSQPDNGMSPRPQQTSKCWLFLTSYVHVSVTLWPM